MIRGYFIHEIRGAQGENCPPDTQQENIRLATQKANVIREKFPEIILFVPHEMLVFNEMYFSNQLSGDDILDIEISLMLQRLFDFAVCVGSCHQKTGCEREAGVMHGLGLPVIFLDDVEEASLETLANRLVSMNE